MTADDLAVFARLRAFYGQLRTAAGAMRATMAATDFPAQTQAIGFEGFPVQTTVAPRDPKHSLVTTVQSVRRQDPPAGAFDLPAGYAKVEMGRPDAPD
ncbi:MAG: DUF4412 domain-containing protein [Roseiarcus sp.]|jgi:hypothetical protein